MLASTKHGSSGTHRKPRKSQNGQLHQPDVVLGSQRLPFCWKGSGNILWDSQFLIYIDNIGKREMVTGIYYAELLG